MRAALGLALCVGSGACRRHPSAPAPPPIADAGAGEITVRVPVALQIARSLDSLSVAIDAASEGDTTVAPDPGMVLGVESEIRVFARGAARPDAPMRHGYTSGTSFDAGTSTWNRAQDGIPTPDEKYVVEVRLVLFETDVPAGHMWNPHAGRYRELLSRTIRQAEE